MRPRRVAPGLYRLTRRRRTTYLGGRTFRIWSLGRWWLVFNIERKRPGGWSV